MARRGSADDARQALVQLRKQLASAARRRPTASDERTPPPRPRRDDGEDFLRLLRESVGEVVPLRNTNRVDIGRPPPRPLPLQREHDELSALHETLHGVLSLEDRLDSGEETAFIRPGLPRRVLLDLRRGRWVRQAELDLHGFNREQARSALVAFLNTSLQRGHRCVRIIHGKGLGSPGRESILKQLSRGWLAQREEILAFCQAPPHQGGAGAVLVLLRGPSNGSSGRHAP